MSTRALSVATGVGVTLQLAMVVAGHYVPRLQELFGLGGMGFSFVAGLLLTWLARAEWSFALLGGATAGGLCALIAIGLSVGLGDVPPALILLGTFYSMITGTLGGAIGKVVFG
jgi:hypothetical protein